ncbi:MAG: SH3 domain-containing protein [Burkholderiales bacterium]|nr:SH3 domain-containing protein [Anaerolineae bacterium]
MRYRLVLTLLILALLVLSACNLTSGPVENEPLATLPTSNTGRPEVTIDSPESGDEVVVNEDILVSASVSDTVGVTRVQLVADGQIVKTVSSDSPTGDLNETYILDYRPRQAGDVTLEVIAYRAATASDPAEIEITVRANVAQVTATVAPAPNVPQIDPNDPTCRILTNTGVNLRTGPGTNYDRIRDIAAGVQVPIIGRLGSNEWWQVRSGNTIGWMSAAYATLYGNCGGIPIVLPPPSPTSSVATATRTNTPIPNVPTATYTPTRTPGPADLVISSIEGEETLSLDGETEIVSQYSIVVTNTGAGSTGQFANMMLLQPDNTELDLGVVGNLAPGENILLTIEVTFTAVGSYTLQARTDSDSQVAEQSEVNNLGIFEVVVTS